MCVFDVNWKRVCTWLLHSSDLANHIVDPGHLLVAVHVHAHFTETKHTRVSSCGEGRGGNSIWDRAVSSPHFSAKSPMNPGPIRYDTFRAPFQSGGGDAPPIFLQEARK